MVFGRLAHAAVSVGFPGVRSVDRPKHTPAILHIAVGMTFLGHCNVRVGLFLDNDKPCTSGASAW